MAFSEYLENKNTEREMGGNMEEYTDTVVHLWENLLPYGTSKLPDLIGFPRKDGQQLFLQPECQMKLHIC